MQNLMLHVIGYENVPNVYVLQMNEGIQFGKFSWFDEWPRDGAESKMFLIHFSSFSFFVLKWNTFNLFCGLY